MVTKYDIFEIVYTNERLRPTDIVKKLGKSDKEYKNIYRILTGLEREGLLIKTADDFLARREGKAKQLYELVHYCLSNEINYNLLLDRGLADFIKQGLSKGEVNQKNIQINPRTFAKYVQILNNYGLLLLISKKPLRAKILYNSLINNLLVYFGFKHLDIKEAKLNYLDEIKKELAAYKTLRKKNEAGFQRIVGEFEVYFVHHSLALEGNPITLPDTIKILRDKIIPADLKSEDVDELKNYQNAILQMLKDSQSNKSLTIGGVLNYHRLALSHKPEIAGKIREIEVHIRGNPEFRVSKAKDIEADLEILFSKYNKFLEEKSNIEEIIRFASYFHNEFQHIHPFTDGNSRITRLITFHLLHSKGVPILDIPFGLLDEYIKDTKGSKVRKDKDLFESLQKIILFNLKKINERLEV